MVYLPTYSRKQFDWLFCHFLVCSIHFLAINIWVLAIYPLLTSIKPKHFSGFLLWYLLIHLFFRLKHEWAYTSRSSGEAVKMQVLNQKAWCVAWYLLCLRNSQLLEQNHTSINKISVPSYFCVLITIFISIPNLR